MTDFLALAFAGGASWAIVAAVRRWHDAREQVKACEPHDRYLDPEPAWAPTYRCRRCKWQAPAMDVLEGRRREMDAAIVRRCPKCGGDVPPDA